MQLTLDYLCFCVFFKPNVAIFMSVCTNPDTCQHCQADKKRILANPEYVCTNFWSVELCKGCAISSGISVIVVSDENHFVLL